MQSDFVLASCLLLFARVALEWLTHLDDNWAFYWERSSRTFLRPGASCQFWIHQSNNGRILLLRVSTTRSSFESKGGERKREPAESRHTKRQNQKQGKVWDLEQRGAIMIIISDLSLERRATLAQSVNRSSTVSQPTDDGLTFPWRREGSCCALVFLAGASLLLLLLAALLLLFVAILLAASLLELMLLSLSQLPSPEVAVVTTRGAASADGARVSAIVMGGWMIQARMNT